MARKMKKSAKIRGTSKARGAKARSKDVISTLAAKSNKVSAAQASNVKASLAGHKQKGPGGRIRGTEDTVAIADLQAAKKFVKALGSIRKAEVALNALAQLQ